MNKPAATLLTATPSPLMILWNAWYWTRDPTKVYVIKPGRPAYRLGTDEFTPDPNRPSVENFMQHALQMLKEHVPIPEMVHMTWGLENIPRSFQEQIVRTRQAAFFCETHRVVDKSDFYYDGDFFDSIGVHPPGWEMVRDGEDMYYKAMRAAQLAYRDLIKHGVPPELARGVLPMHVNSRLAMGINLREFARLMAQRTCWIAQGSYWLPLMASMRPQMEEYIGKEVSDSIFRPPCQGATPVCIMEGEAEARLRGEGPYQPCPLYSEIFKKDVQK